MIKGPIQAESQFGNSTLTAICRGVRCAALPGLRFRRSHTENMLRLNPRA
jgi:hypothetical protein